MAVLTTQRPAIAGDPIAFTAATSGATGEEFAADPNGILLVNNASGSAVTGTIQNPGVDQYNVQQPDPTFSCPAGAITAVGQLGQGWPEDLVDPATGRIKVTWSAVATLTVAYLVP